MSDIVILDGPDGCGKTNIADALSEILEISVFKNKGEWKFFSQEDNGFFKTCLKYSHTHLLEFLQQTDYGVIFDRAYPSEYVYSQVFNRETDHDILRWCDKKCAQMGVKIIIPIRSDYSNVVDQFDFVDETILNDVHRKYIEFSNWTECECMILNVDDEDLDREIKEISSFLNIGDGAASENRL